MITGSTGMLGQDLVRIFSSDSSYEVFGSSRQSNSLLPNANQFLVDLANLQAVQSIDIMPDIVLHTAAITDLSVCENNPDYAEQVHVEGSVAIAKLLKPGGKLFYISTDSVFDGEGGAYSESAQPNPGNIYSKTKLKGEKEVQLANLGQTTIVRTNIFGFHVPIKNSLCEWALREWELDKTIFGFTDIIFNAIYTGQLVSILKFMIDNDISMPIINIASKSSVSKFDFLDGFRRRLDFGEGLLAPALSSDFPSVVKRPRNTSLNTELLSKFYSVPSIESGIDNLASDLINLGLFKKFH